MRASAVWHAVLWCCAPLSGAFLSRVAWNDANWIELGWVGGWTRRKQADAEARNASAKRQIDISSVYTGWWDLSLNSGRLCCAGAVGPDRPG